MVSFALTVEQKEEEEEDEALCVSIELLEPSRKQFPIIAFVGSHIRRQISVVCVLARHSWSLLLDQLDFRVPIQPLSTLLPLLDFRHQSIHNAFSLRRKRRCKPASPAKTSRNSN